jgi:hypothetical protein
MKKQTRKKNERQEITDKIKDGLKKPNQPIKVPKPPKVVPPKFPPYVPEPWDTWPWVKPYNPWPCPYHPRRRKCPCPNCPGHDDYEPTIVWCGTLTKY